MISLSNVETPFPRIGSWPRSESVVLNEWVMRTLALSTVIPGFSAFISGLLTGHVPSQHYGNAPRWFSDYVEGQASRITIAPAPAAVDGYSFTDVASRIEELSEGAVVAWGVLSAPDDAFVRDSQTRATAAGRRTRRRSELSTQHQNLSGLPANSWDLSLGIEQGSVEDDIATACRNHSAAALLVNASSASAGGWAAPAHVTSPGGAGLQSPSRGGGSRDSLHESAGGAARGAEPVAAAPCGLAEEALYLPGSLIFNPGPQYRMRKGEMLVLCAKSAKRVDDVLSDPDWAKDFEQAEDYESGVPRLKKEKLEVDNYLRPGLRTNGYGFPHTINKGGAKAPYDSVWSWGKSASRARVRERVRARSPPSITRAPSRSSHTLSLTPRLPCRRRRRFPPYFLRLVSRLQGPAVLGPRPVLGVCQVAASAASPPGPSRHRRARPPLSARHVARRHRRRPPRAAERRH